MQLLFPQRLAKMTEERSEEKQNGKWYMKKNQVNNKM